MADKNIEFPVNVGGKPMLATIMAEEGNEVQFAYRIRFSNGYEDVFCLDEGLVEGDNRETSIPYASAIRMDISNVIKLDPDKFWHVFQYPVDGAATNIWVIERDGVYRVSYNDFYRFELTNQQGQWIVSSKDRLDKIDPVIAGKVEDLLKALV